MNEFQLLKQRAKKKRDAAIQAARAEYKLAVARITDLRRRLGGKSQRASRDIQRPVKDVICEVIPRDRTFSVREAFELLQKSDPTRNFYLPTVRYLFGTLHREGVVRRVRCTQRGVVLWAVTELEVDETEFGAMNLRGVAELILRQRGPMRATEMVVEIQSRNYRPEADPHTLLSSLCSRLSRNPELFRQGDDGRWGLCL